MADDSASLDQKITETMSQAYKDATSNDDTVTDTSVSQATPETSSTETPSTSAAAPKPSAERPRDESGKFAKNEQGQQQAQQNQQNQTQVKTRKAPGTWKKEAQEKFSTIPEDLQEEILRREEDFLRGIGQYTDSKRFADEVRRVVQPYEAMIRAEGGTVPTAIAQLMHTAYQLRFAPPAEKTQLFRELAANFGVDLNGVTSEEANIDPNIDALQRELATIRQAIYQQQSTAEQQIYSDVHSEIQSFAQGRPHFDQVSEAMGTLIETGQAKSLQDAYDKAVWMNPDIRAQLIAEQQSDAQKKTQERLDDARRAKDLNLNSRPVPNPSAPVGTVDETMRSVYRRMNP